MRVSRAVGLGLRAPASLFLQNISEPTIPSASVDAPDGAVRVLRGFALDQWFVDALIGIYQDYRRSGTDSYASAVTNTLERVTGRPPRSLDDLLSQL